MSHSDSVSALLLDIEGTTTPISYVFDILFPFARNQVEAFLQMRGQEADVQADLLLLRQEYQTESGPVPPWAEGGDPATATPYIHHLIRCDRKSTGLKSLQGKIWHEGYQSGQLRSQLFPDVKPAFERWLAAGKSIYIFSSGSVQAQKLIFRYSQDGDLTSFISGYFDTTTGPKRETESYHKIANQMGRSPRHILFISDVAAELRPAQAAGFQTLFSSRPGNRTDDAEGFTKIEDFGAV
ncbi:MAG: acireductone synthase [Leptolyngbyaceae cyanobacterium MO_188.B28]|nr:acireductone synthase [Leptolyngbyaceae cyanobacterium MO_188.B28]